MSAMNCHFIAIKKHTKYKNNAKEHKMSLLLHWNAHGYTKIPLNIYGCPWRAMHFHSYPWIASIDGYPWVWYRWTKLLLVNLEWIGCGHWGGGSASQWLTILQKTGMAISPTHTLIQNSPINENVPKSDMFFDILTILEFLIGSKYINELRINFFVIRTRKRLLETMGFLISKHARPKFSSSESNWQRAFDNTCKWIYAKQTTQIGKVLGTILRSRKISYFPAFL